MKKILVIGSKGLVGAVIHKNLKDSYDVTEFELPEHDLANYEDVLRAMRDKDVVVYAAIATTDEKQESWRNTHIDPKNIVYEMNVLEAVAEAKVPRLIVSSSVHADGWLQYEGSELLKTPGSYQPISQYGTHKIILEETCKYFARRYGFECIALRLGGVTRDGNVRTVGREPIVWLSHRDLGAAINACVQADSVPGHFISFYLVSNNDGKVHGTVNPFGWEPKDNSTQHLAEHE